MKQAHQMHQAMKAKDAANYYKLSKGLGQLTQQWGVNNAPRPTQYLWAGTIGFVEGAENVAWAVQSAFEYSALGSMQLGFDPLGSGKAVVGGVGTLVSDPPGTTQRIIDHQVALFNENPSKWFAGVGVGALLLAAGLAQGGQIHHAIPFNHRTFKHHTHDLVVSAQVNIEHYSRNQRFLWGHNGRHLHTYHQAVQDLLDEAWETVSQQGLQGPALHQAARRELDRLIDDIWTAINNKTMRPNNHPVWLRLPLN